LGPEATKIGQALELLTETMFHAWHQVRSGTLRRAGFQALMIPLRQQVVAWLHDGQSCAVRKVASQCREILKLEAALWTFVHTEGVEPTNNAAELIVRHGVLWRKGSFGTDSPNGSRFVERILTVVLTLRLQKRNVLDYMTAACEASLRGEPPPSLLPA
jgi:transposase